MFTNRKRLQLVKFVLEKQGVVSKSGRVHVVEQAGFYWFYLYTPLGPRQAKIDGGDGSIRSYIIEGKEWSTYEDGSAKEMVIECVDGELMSVAKTLGYVGVKRVKEPMRKRI